MRLVAIAVLTLAVTGLAHATPATNLAPQVGQALAGDVLATLDTGSVVSRSGTDDIAFGGDGKYHDKKKGGEPVEVIPEPATLALLGIGLGLAALRRRKD